MSELVKHYPSRGVNAKWKVLDRVGLVDYLLASGFESASPVLGGEVLRLEVAGCFVSVYTNGTVYVTGKRRAVAIALLRKVERPARRRAVRVRYRACRRSGCGGRSRLSQTYPSGDWFWICDECRSEVSAALDDVG